MKISVPFVVTSTLLLSISAQATPALANPDTTMNMDKECRPSLWMGIQTLAKNATNGSAKDFRIIDEITAEVSVSGRHFKIKLYDSEFADYGDLNDVIATELEGSCQIELRAVPASGDLLAALGVNQPDWLIEDVESVPSEF